MEFVSTDMPGLLQVSLSRHDDVRGRFVKVFHEPTYRSNGLATHFSEEFYSQSSRRVLRGLHFQTPPHESIKLVYCVEGCVLDAVVDLRRNSPTFGQHRCFELDAQRPSALYIPSGLAHGFYVLSDSALMVYKVTEPYSPDHDLGIRWDSCAIPWQDADPIISSRDSRFPEFKNYQTPFSFK